MKFLDRLYDIKPVVLEEWFSYTVDSYPSETSRFLKNQKDPFTNPVGQTTFDSLSRLLEGLIVEVDTKELKIAIDPIMRIRAVQAFKPSEAISFIFALKDIVYRCLNIDRICNSHDGFLHFSNRVDVLSMVAFDVYMVCREQVYELKASEARNQFFSSLSRAGLIVET